jgi:Pentapeptide repeats (9 copies)
MKALAELPETEAPQPTTRRHFLEGAMLAAGGAVSALIFRENAAPTERLIAPPTTPGNKDESLPLPYLRPTKPAQVALDNSVAQLNKTQADAKKSAADAWTASHPAPKESPFRDPAYLTAILAGLGTAGAALRYVANRHDEAIKSRADRLEAERTTKLEVQKAEDIAYAEFAKSLRKAPKANEDEQIAVVVDLQLYALPSQERHHEDLMRQAVEMLRRRKVDVANPHKPNMVDESIIEAFLSVGNHYVTRFEKLEASDKTPTKSKLGTITAKLGLQQSLTPIVYAREVILDEADLTGAVLRRFDFNEATFRSSDSQCAQFKDCNLTGAKFSSAELQGAMFKNCNCNETDFAGARIDHAVFDGINLSKARIRSVASARGTVIKGAHGLSNEVVQILETKGAVFKG